MDAIVAAGGVPRPEDPLYPLTRGAPKALLEINGKSLIQWVIDALDGARGVERIAVVGLPSASGLRCAKPLLLVAGRGGMLQNLSAGVDELARNRPGQQQILALASDIPAITPAHVDWMVERVLESEDDIYYNVIERGAMEKVFPGARRSYVRLKDAEICGGDINAVRASIVSPDNPLYRRLIDARKSVRRQAAIVGYGTFINLLLRRYGVEDAARAVSKRLGVRGRALRCPYAEMGMDIDKPHQYELLCAHLGLRRAV